MKFVALNSQETYLNLLSWPEVHPPIIIVDLHGLESLKMIRTQFVL